MTDERKNEIWATLPSDYQKYVRLWYEDVIDNNEQTEHIFEGLFGAHNLTAQAEEKPNEPRFKVGDKVIYGPANVKGTITRLCKGIIREFLYDIENSYACYSNCFECDLAPYTEPKSQDEQSVSSNAKNCENPTESGISDSKNQSESIESVEKRRIEDGRIVIPIKSEFDDSVYAAYRLDLAREIAVAMIKSYNEPVLRSIAEVAVDTANEIVKRLKETDNENA